MEQDDDYDYWTWPGRSGVVDTAGVECTNMIHIIRSRATAQQMTEMLEALDGYIKLAVDVQRGILAGGGAMHADCESVLLEDGSTQQDVWGADWYPSSQQVAYESLINIRPRQGNRSLEVTDPELRARIANIVHALLGEI
jgi:hypothetical protein